MQRDAQLKSRVPLPLSGCERLVSIQGTRARALYVLGPPCLVCKRGNAPGAVTCRDLQDPKKKQEKSFPDDVRSIARLRTGAAARYWRFGGGGRAVQHAAMPTRQMPVKKYVE